MSKKPKSCSHLKAVPSDPNHKPVPRLPNGLRPVFEFAPYESPASDLLAAMDIQGRTPGGPVEGPVEGPDIIRAMREWSKLMLSAALMLQELTEIVEGHNIGFAEGSSFPVYLVPEDDAAEDALLKAAEDGILDLAECADCGEPVMATTPESLCGQEAKKPKMVAVPSDDSIPPPPTPPGAA